MNGSQLDQFLHQLATRPVPAVPANINDAVWREIRLRRETDAMPGFFDWLAGYVWRGPFALASMTAAVVLGVALVWQGAEGVVTPPASLALELQVFSEHPPTLRLTSFSLEP